MATNRISISCPQNLLTPLIVGLVKVGEISSISQSAKVSEWYIIEFQPGQDCAIRVKEWITNLISLSPEISLVYTSPYWLEKRSES